MNTFYKLSVISSLFLLVSYANGAQDVPACHRVNTVPEDYRLMVHRANFSITHSIQLGMNQTCILTLGEEDGNIWKAPGVDLIDLGNRKYQITNRSHESLIYVTDPTSYVAPGFESYIGFTGAHGRAIVVHT